MHNLKRSRKASEPFEKSKSRGATLLIDRKRNPKTHLLKEPRASSKGLRYAPSFLNYPQYKEYGCH